MLSTPLTPSPFTFRTTQESVEIFIEAVAARLKGIPPTDNIIISPSAHMRLWKKQRGVSIPRHSTVHQKIEKGCPLQRSLVWEAIMQLEVLPRAGRLHAIVTVDAKLINDFYLQNSSLYKSFPEVLWTVLEMGPSQQFQSVTVWQPFRRFQLVKKRSFFEASRAAPFASI